MFGCFYEFANMFHFVVTFNCNCNGNRCFRNGETIHCCNSECVAGCMVGGNADQCQVKGYYIDSVICLTTVGL